jgi:hypothetical protein
LFGFPQIVVVSPRPQQMMLVDVARRPISSAVGSVFPCGCGS